MTAIRSLPNLGPAIESALNKVGIMTAEDLRATGADAAYARLLDHGTRPHFIGYTVIVLALQGRPWSDCHGEEKRLLRARFDALKLEAGNNGSVKSTSPGRELATFLREIGLSG